MKFETADKYNFIYIIYYIIVVKNLKSTKNHVVYI